MTDKDDKIVVAGVYQIDMFMQDDVAKLSQYGKCPKNCIQKSEHVDDCPYLFASYQCKRALVITRQYIKEGIIKNVQKNEVKAPRQIRTGKARILAGKK